MTLHATAEPEVSHPGAELIRRSADVHDADRIGG